MVAGSPSFASAPALAQVKVGSKNFTEQFILAELYAQALEAEAQAQAICMKTKDFERAYVAFASKQKPAFEGD